MNQYPPQKKKLLTIIIPTYNCANYIEECIESIVRQRISVEVVIVDDASTDNTEQRIKTIIDNKHFNSVIHFQYSRNKVNCGVAFSRNKGLSLTLGEYVIFLDADDVIFDIEALSIIEKCLLCDANEPLDLLICNRYAEFNCEEKRIITLFSEGCCGETNPRSLKLRCQNLSSVCCSIFRTKLLKDNEITFQHEYSCGEDTDFFFRSLVKARNLRIIDCLLLGYRSNPGSITHNKNLRNILDVMKMCKNTIDFLKENIGQEERLGISIEKALDFYSTKYLHFAFQSRYLSDDARKVVIKILGEQIPYFGSHLLGRKDIIIYYIIRLFGARMVLDMAHVLWK